MNTKHTDSVEDLRQEFTKWLTAETSFATGVPDDRSIADWWLEKISSLQATHSQQVEEVKEEAWAASKLLWDRMTEWNKEWQAQNPGNELTHKDAVFLIEWKMRQQVEEAVRKDREQIIRGVNSFSARYPEYGIRLYQWEDGTLGMDTISFEDAVNNKQGSFRPYLYKEDLTPNHQD